MVNRRTTFGFRARESSDESGFTLLELVLAIGMSVAILYAGMMGVHGMTLAVSQPLARIQDVAGFNTLEDRLRGEAESASSIGITPNQQGLIFYYLNADHTWSAHVYTLCPPSTPPGHGLLTYTSALIGTTPSSSFVVPAQGEILDAQVTAVSTAFISGTDLDKSHVPTAELFNGVHAPKTYSTILGPTTAMSGAYEIEIKRGASSRTIHLQTAVAPTGFGIESGPEWHVGLNRTPHTSHGLFSQSTTYSLAGELDYSYDHWHSWKTWCTAQIYGESNQSDWQFRDTSVAVDPQQRAEHIFRLCQKNRNKIAPTISDTPSPAYND